MIFLTFKQEYNNGQIERDINSIKENYFSIDSFLRAHKPTSRIPTSDQRVLVHTGRQFHIGCLVGDSWILEGTNKRYKQNEILFWIELP